MEELGGYNWVQVIKGQPLHTSRMRHKVNFMRKIAGLNSIFSFSFIGCHIKTKELSLPLLAEARIVGFKPFQRVSALCEMLKVSSRI